MGVILGMSHEGLKNGILRRIFGPKNEEIIGDW
jgi:hypothetical protein